jgi:hypothetical protein
MGCWDGQRRYQSHVTEVHIVIPGKLAIAGATWNPGVFWIPVFTVGWQKSR